MKVSVKLFATLARRVPAHIVAQQPQPVRAGMPWEVELPQGSTLADLVAHLELPPEELKVMFVNGRARSPDYVLQSGDEVGIFPPVGGG